jgi:hypothetical protein
MTHHVRGSLKRVPTTFQVWGPFEVPTTSLGAKRVQLDALPDFWRSVVRDDTLANAHGCYVFAMRAGKGMTPLYVGRASRQSFRHECFASHKLVALIEAFAYFKKGTPVLFLVCTAKGRPNLRAIQDMEEFLIQNARVRNPNLQNVQLTQEPGWRIAGVFGSQSGKPSRKALLFKKLLGIGEPSRHASPADGSSREAKIRADLTVIETEAARDLPEESVAS